MAARPQFNDSSGDYVEATNKVPQSYKGRHPEALELRDLSCTPLSRDSGCFTGSPMTATRGEMSDAVSSSHFTFEESVTSAEHSAFVSSTPLGDSGTHSLTSYLESLDSEDDDVFHSSEDVDFLDSGIQALGFEDDRKGETGSETEIDEDSSTASDEFGTAEFELAGDSPISSPIDIPARQSRNSTPETDEQLDEDEEVFPAAVGSEPKPSAFLPHLIRRATLGQINSSAVASRPQSGHGRVQGNAVRPQFYSQSVEGAEGPLPDVVPSELRRCRAMSESAIYTNRHIQSVGLSLREISDEFSDRRLQRQRNQLHLIQQRQQSPNHVRSPRPTNSCPAANQNRRSLFSSIHRRLFSSSHE